MTSVFISITLDGVTSVSRIKNLRNSIVKRFPLHPRLKRISDPGYQVGLQGQDRKLIPGLYFYFVLNLKTASLCWVPKPSSLTNNTYILGLWIHFLGKKHYYINLSVISFILEGLRRTGRLTERNENLFPIKKQMVEKKLNSQRAWVWSGCTM